MSNKENVRKKGPMYTVKKLLPYYFFFKYNQLAL